MLHDLILSATSQDLQMRSVDRETGKAGTSIIDLLVQDTSFPCPQCFSAAVLDWLWKR
jgi:hypothetical protein